MPETLQTFLADNSACVLVKIIDAKGSTPREADAWMLVGNTEIFETIGGGQLEYQAIDHARKMLSDLPQSGRRLKVPLGPEIGQCCGGVVDLKFELMGDDQREDFSQEQVKLKEYRPQIYIFGAGHVGSALLAALKLLPVNIVIIDSRKSQLEKLMPSEGNWQSRLLAMPESIIDEARPGASFIILTHDHAQDFMIAERALLRCDAAFVGMIGSATKLEKFKRQFVENGHGAALIENLTCPIGMEGSIDKRPQIIAALVVAQIANIHFADKARP